MSGQPQRRDRKRHDQQSPRIVSLLASATEIVAGLGLADRLIAVSHECDSPISVTKRLPKATYSMLQSPQTGSISQDIDRQVKRRLQLGEPLYGIDEALIRRLQPDWIITQAQCDVCAVRLDDVRRLVETSAELADTQVLSLQPESLPDVLDDVWRIAEAMDEPERGHRYLAQLRQRIQTVRQAADNASRPRVVCIEWIAPLMIAGNWTPELIETAGGRPGLIEAGQHSVYVEWAQIVRYDPQVLIVAPCGFDRDTTRRESKTLLELPGWDQLSAVRQDRVHLLDGNAYFNRSGPRLVDTLEMLSELLA